MARGSHPRTWCTPMESITQKCLKFRKMQWDMSKFWRFGNNLFPFSPGPQGRGRKPPRLSILYSIWDKNPPARHPDRSISWVFYEPFWAPLRICLFLVIAGGSDSRYRPKNSKISAFQVKISAFWPNHSPSTVEFLMFSCIMIAFSQNPTRKSLNDLTSDWNNQFLFEMRRFWSFSVDTYCRCPLL